MGCHKENPNFERLIDEGSRKKVSWRRGVYRTVMTGKPRVAVTLDL